MLIILDFLVHVTLASVGYVSGLEPVDASCASPWSRGELHATYYRGAQSCPPGGPCELVSVNNQPVEELKIQVQGCPTRLPGRFVPTEKRCRGGVRLSRFVGHVPPGRVFNLVARHTQAGTFRSPGRRQPLNCTGVAHPAPVEVLRAALDHTLMPAVGAAMLPR